VNQLSNNTIKITFSRKII